MNIEQTLKQRGERYGSFKDGAKVMQELKRAAKRGGKWQDMSSDKKEAIEMILHKVGRIVNGDPGYDDNWRDIAGYAKLVLDDLECEK